jgi:two-component system, NarL family, sensor histidine kinase EvgS
LLVSRCLAGVTLALAAAWGLHGPATAQSGNKAAAAALSATTVPAAPLFFKASKTSVSPSLSTQVLTPEERAFVAALPEVRVAVPFPPYAPYELVSSTGEVSGLHPDMLVALGRAFGLRFKPVAYSTWSAAMEAAQRKEVDVLMTLGVTPERLQFLHFTLGATPAPAALFMRENTQGSETALKTGRFALERDHVSNDHIRRNYPRASILTVETTGDALRAVVAGRADFYLGSLLATADVVAREGIEDVAVNRLLNYGTGLFHFGVRKDWPLLATVLNKGMQNLRQPADGGVDSSAAAGMAAGGAASTAASGGLVASVSANGMLMRPPLSLSEAQRNELATRSVWRVGAVRGLAMLNDFDTTNGHTGLGADYLGQVAQRLGVVVQLTPFDNVASMLAALRSGSIDVVPLLSKTSQRAADFGYSQPYIDIPYVIVARTTAPMFWSLDSLRGKRLALGREHPLRELVAQSYPTITVVDADNGAQAMDMVRDGLADAAVEIKLFANLRVNGDGDNLLRVTANVDELPAQFYFATSRQAGAIVPLVNTALADIAPEDRTRILRRWVAQDLRPSFPWRRYLPLIVVSGLSLLALAGGTWWWMRRLSGEVVARRRSEGLLKDIAATVPGVVFRYVLGADGKLQHLFMSAGSYAFLGVEKPATSQRVFEVMAPHMSPADQAACLAGEQHSVLTGLPFKITVAYRNPRDGEQWLHAESTRSEHSANHQVWTGYVVDVTPERQLQAKLGREAETRNLLLASASHELRAPTHTLSLALQSVSGRGLAAEETAALVVARQSALTLGQLLNDVLDAARFSNQAIKLRPRSFDLHALVQEVAGAWRAAAGTKGLAFECDVRADVPKRVVQDPLRLKQILTNLLSNACKYTVQGRVWLLVSRDAEGGLRFVVGDSGVGVAAHVQDTLFQPFATAQGPARTALPEGSTGLGLSICRRLATLMHGRIELRSVLGEGTVVTLSLPPDTVPVVADAPNRSGKILVCDDDPVSRMMMTQMLKRAGFDAEDTSDGNEALQRWRQGGVAAIVTDLDMPGLSGLQLMRSVREAEAQARLKPGAAHPAPTVLVVCSGSELPDAGDSVRDDNLHDAYLVKPVQMDILAQTLRDVGFAEH